MMHVYYCLKCKKYFYTNNKAHAVCCEATMHEMQISFTDFVKMDEEERQVYFRRCPELMI